MHMHVAASGLNLRERAPDGSVIAVLPCGHAVTVAGEAGAGWVDLECADPAEPARTLTGTAAARFLRPAIVGAREALVAAALAEWRRFDYGAGHEAQPPYRDHVGRMWAAVGFPTFDGATREYPWSAAAISWIVRQAAKQAPALDDFDYAIGHWRYIKDAIAKREAGHAAPFWARRLDEAAARIGDIVVRARAGASGHHAVDAVDTYDAARDAKGSFPSHCDLITGLSGGQAHAIGGNVNNSVNLTSFPLEPDGRLKAAGGVFMVLQCRL